MPVNAVARNIKRIRTSKNISQECMAESLNITRQAISNWETGKTQPNTDMLMNISNVLDVDITELIYGQKTKSEYDLLKKDRIKNAIILTVAFIGLFILRILVLKRLDEINVENFGIPWYGMIFVFYSPLIYIVAGSAIASIISIWADFRIMNYRVRKNLLILAAALVWVYFILSCLVLYNMDEIILLFFWMLNNPAIFMVPGFIMFVGLHGDKEEIKKTLTTVSVITALCMIICTLDLMRYYIEL